MSNDNGEEDPEDVLVGLALDQDHQVFREIHVEDLDAIGAIPWHYHPLRQFLVKKLQEDDFPADYNKMGSFDVWNKYCDEDVFEGMEYDAAFKRRLLALRKQYAEGQSRAKEDFAAFLIAKANHPPPALNHRGEPQWNGSEAQQLLNKELMTRDICQKSRIKLWGDRPQYKLFQLTTFRDHLHQEIQTRKYLYTLKKRDEEKGKKVIEKAKKRQRRKRKTLRIN